jgi:hypothetical protein
MPPTKPFSFGSPQTTTSPSPKYPFAGSISDSDSEPPPSPVYIVITNTGDPVWNHSDELYSTHEEAKKHAKEKAASLMQEGIGTWRESYFSVQLVRVEICGEKFHTYAQFLDPPPPPPYHLSVGRTKAEQPHWPTDLNKNRLHQGQCLADKYQCPSLDITRLGWSSGMILA